MVPLPLYPLVLHMVHACQELLSFVYLSRPQGRRLCAVRSVDALTEPFIMPLILDVHVRYEHEALQASPRVLRSWGC